MRSSRVGGRKIVENEALSRSMRSLIVDTVFKPKGFVVIYQSFLHFGNGFYKCEISYMGVPLFLFFQDNYLFIGNNNSIGNIKIGNCFKLEVDLMSPNSIKEIEDFIDEYLVKYGVYSSKIKRVCLS